MWLGDGLSDEVDIELAMELGIWSLAWLISFVIRFVDMDDRVEMGYRSRSSDWISNVGVGRGGAGLILEESNSSSWEENILRTME